MRKFISDLAEGAGRIHLGHFSRAVDFTLKGSPQNRLTKADLESERFIVSKIKVRFPDHNILAEENKYAQTSSPFTWVIDPLDGTNNFSHGVPHFCVSIGLVFKGSSVCGCVYDPVRKEMFLAEKKKGALLNGKNIHVTSQSSLKGALMATGFYYDRGKQAKENLKRIGKFFDNNILGIRRMGAAALDLSYVACGRYEGFWEFYLNPWDMAAGMVIIQEAGGKLSDMKGKPLGLEPSSIIASNGKLHTEMLRVISK